MKCKICNTVNSNIVYDYSYKNIKYYKCKNCLLVFQNPMPNNFKLREIYNKDYFKKNYYLSSKLLKLRKKQYRIDQSNILKFYDDNKNNKILDYGCGNGEFLKLFKSKKYGYEINKDAIVNENIIRLDSKKVTKFKYDLIIMRGVIEHLYNFDSVIRKLSKCLKKKGLFFIAATPNTNNLTFFLSKKNFNQNHPGHLFHFNNVNLSLFFLKLNYLNIFVAYDYFDTPYANIQNDYIDQKKQLKKYYKNREDSFSKSPPGTGNMITSIFKKMD